MRRVARFSHALAMHKSALHALYNLQSNANHFIHFGSNANRSNVWTSSHHVRKVLHKLWIHFDLSDVLFLDTFQYLATRW